jgi:uncharacterized coiled-coil DUF342 family protein
LDKQIKELQEKVSPLSDEIRDLYVKRNEVSDKNAKNKLREFIDSIFEMDNTSFFKLLRF